MRISEQIVIYLIRIEQVAQVGQVVIGRIAVLAKHLPEVRQVILVLICEPVLVVADVRRVAELVADLCDRRTSRSE